MDYCAKYQDVDLGERKGLLVGTKCDLETERQVEQIEAKKFASESNLEYIEVSSKKDVNINELFDRIIEVNLNESFLGKSKEIVNLIENSTLKRIENVLFDTKGDDWDIGTCRIGEKMIWKSNLFILIISKEGNCGCFVSSQVDQLGKYISDPKCTIYSFNSMESFSIKSSKQAIKFHQAKDSEFITIGKEDIVLFKKRKNTLCYCKQSSFDYRNKQNVLVGKEGKKNTFTLDRLVVFQLV